MFEAGVVKLKWFYLLLYLIALRTSHVTVLFSQFLVH